ncbi:tetratricopeptide repeat protein [Porphyromonas sp. oral taxon 278 str. W7784]|uniref:tetratricopeptide repeat protein n=1 Tax=Porphyromonas sp. oral taxon 278 TaxID=712437 RepID=UPI0003AD1FB8|nr:tetratricopeptide repeat protein [Porphyromonas sp. oral taxon 278]ERJ72959.1 tetratricopeptide repeat protein [Porphyromonas sp. oral taxon 278 str. W7784]
MDLTILGEYGLKTALRVALNIKKLYTSEVDNGIISAFEFALNDWSKHTPTTSDKVRLSKVLEEYIQSSMSYEALDTDTQKFIDCFKKRLSEQPAAHRYLMTLRADMQEKSEEQNLLEHHKTQESVLDLKSRMEELNMAPQYIRALLKELPLEQGLERTELVLEEMLTNGRIHSEGAKRLVLEFARFLFEHTDKISEETKLLREAGDSYLAETLEEIKRVLTGESKQSLTAVYEKHKEQARQNEIRVLKELIEAAQIKFSFGEAREFYERLIKLAPTIELHFNYAYLLQNLNDIDKARSHYEEVLQVLRELSKENPELHKPNLATVLNNWGSLLKSANEFQQAQACYREALEIRRKLAEQNPEVYKPYVAITLNNIGNLLCDTNELQQAQACYKEALQKYRELPEHSLEVYKPDMAMVLNNLGILLKNTNELQQAQSCYEEALKIHQESAKHNQETYKPDLATTQQNLTLLYLQQGKKEEAEEAYQEAYDIYQDLASHYPRAYGIDYAQLLVIGFDLLGKPKKYLEETKAILDKYPEHSKAQELLSIIEQLDNR